MTLKKQTMDNVTINSYKQLFRMLIIKENSFLEMFLSPNFQALVCFYHLKVLNNVKYILIIITLLLDLVYTGKIEARN